MFKAEDTAKAVVMYSKIFSPYNFEVIKNWIINYRMPLGFMLAALIFQYLPIKFYTKLEKIYNMLNAFSKALIFAIVIVVIYQFLSAESLPFIYLEF
jgi:hypothetical protein